MSALTELKEFMNEGEAVEAIVFGAWGWGSGPDREGKWDTGYGEPDPAPVPFEKRGTVLTLEEAAPMMESWSFYGGFGAPNCYAVSIWTNKRLIWVTQYDGSTSLDSAARNPTNELPSMPGG